LPLYKLKLKNAIVKKGPNIRIQQQGLDHFPARLCFQGDINKDPTQDRAKEKSKE
jgi:hypothetical protein